MSLNSINLVGAAIDDYRPISDTFGVFRMVNRHRRGSEEVLFIDVKVFGKLAEICYDHVRKSTRVEVVGRLEFQESEKNGKKYRDYAIIANDVHFENTFDKEKD